MNRNQFLSKLAAELSKLPKEEVEAAMEFYTEYLDDVGPENEKEAIESLGSPHRVATQIRADYAIRQMDKEKSGNMDSAKKGLSAIWLAVAGIFAAPIAIPLAIALGCIAIAVIFGLLAVTVGAGVCVLAAGITGIVAIVVGIIALPTALSSGLMFIGGGLTAVAITSIIIVVVCIAVKFLFKQLIKAIHKTNEKRHLRKMEKNKEQFKKEGGSSNEQ